MDGDMDGGMDKHFGTGITLWMKLDLDLKTYVYFCVPS